MLDGLSAWLEGFVPEPLRHGGGELSRRSRTIVWMSAALGPVHLLAGVVSTAVRGPNHLGTMLIGGAAALLLTLPLLQRSRAADAAALWFMSTLLFVGGFVAWTGYGLLSPVVPTFTMIPVVGLVVGGRWLGTLFTGIAVFEVGALVAAPRLGLHPPMVAEGPRFEAMYALVTMIAILGVFGFLSAYEAAWRRAAEQSRARAEDLVAANQAKSRFLAHMSHELRTPLNAVIGYTELLLEDASEGVEELQRVHGAGVHLLSLVDDLLELEKTERGHVTMRPEPLELASLVKVVVDEVRPMAEQHHSVFVRRVPPDLRLVADRRALRQVLANLCSNAAKFTENGRIVVEAEAADDQVRISVSDTGVGMSADDLKVVFEPFGQGFAGQHQGTGLGLAICKQLVKAMGGTLRAESTEGVGSRFTLSLPVRPGRHEGP
jgi:signal transduction histidine kinase